MVERGFKNIHNKYAQMAVLTNKGILITLFFWKEKDVLGIAD